MQKKNSALALVRHGESEWNQQNIFTGWHDIGLSAKGLAEAQSAGKALKQKKINFHCAFTSALIRAQKTLELILQELKLAQLPTISSAALNERDYGDLTGKNKDAVRTEFGAKQVQIWRRSFDIAPPNGESLKDTSERVWPFYQKNIQPHLTAQKNILIVAHGNSLRALIGKLEKLNSQKICQLEIATGTPLIYYFSPQGEIFKKEILT